MVDSNPSQISKSPIVFVSYRRDDSLGHTGRLYDRLANHFGANCVFRDIDTIKAGDDFVVSIQTAINSCHILVVVIGKQWLTISERGLRRLDDPKDYVRLEVAVALRRHIKVIPVLAQGATMPKASDLPKPLKSLARRNAMEISDHRWEYDAERLIKVIEQELAGQAEKFPAPQREPWFTLLLNFRWVKISITLFSILLCAGILLKVRDAIQNTDVQSVYRVRITLIDSQKFPINDAKVTSTLGGEAKKVEGGWEIDIPSASKPKDGKLTIYADQRSASLQGEYELALASDYNPAVTIQLTSSKLAKVRGIVVDELGNAIAGARVLVVGYGNEGITTQNNGHFELPAHQAVGQQVELHAEKKGYKPANQFHPAGDEAVTLVLLR